MSKSSIPADARIELTTHKLATEVTIRTGSRVSASAVFETRVYARFAATRLQAILNIPRELNVKIDLAAFLYSHPGITRPPRSCPVDNRHDRRRARKRRGLNTKEAA